MLKNKWNQFCAMALVILMAGVLLHSLLVPSEAASRKYQYRVISIQGMTELRTQQNTDNGRLATIEKIVNDQAAAGWELMQADGYVLYFRR